MRLTALILASALGFTSIPAFASDPCAPPPTRPVHVAAFATQGPATEPPVPGTPPPSARSGDELAVQTGCLAWEASHARRAEFIGTVPLGSVSPSGAISSLGPSVTVLAVQAPPLPFFPTAIGPVPHESPTAPEKSRSFSLGVSLVAPR